MVSSYTKKEVDKMVDMYTSDPCLQVVSKLSVMLNRPRKSIISKLVREGVYVRKGYTTKTGETPITKLQLVRAIEDAIDTKLPDLEKAPKSTLKMLSDTIVEQSQLLEDTLEELKNTAKPDRVRRDILEILESK